MKGLERTPVSFAAGRRGVAWVHACATPMSFAAQGAAVCAAVCDVPEAGSERARLPRAVRAWQGLIRLHTELEADRPWLLHGRSTTALLLEKEGFVAHRSSHGGWASGG